MAGMSSGTRWWAAVLLVSLAGTVLVLDHQRLDSPTMDEPFHALASAEYALAGTYYANLEHPPLMKLLAGASMALAGVRKPSFARPFSMATAEQPRAFCYGNTIPPDRLFAAARRPFPLLFLALVLLAAGLARRWGGPAAGLATAALLAFEPNLVAHAGVLHTDVAASLGFLGTLALALSALERRSLVLWTLTGAALGLSLASKFSEVFLVPVLLVTVLLHALLSRRKAGRAARADLKPVAGLLLAGAAAAAVLFCTYAVALRSMDRSEAEKAVRIFVTSRGASRDTVERLAALSRVAPPVGHYAAGLAGIALQNRIGGGVNYLHGRLSQEGFWDYFFVAFAVKSSLGFLIFLATAAAVTLLSRGAGLDLRVGALLMGVACIFLSVTGSSYNIGVRHVLPVIPLLAVAGTVLVARSLTTRAAAVLLAACAALQLVETARVHPYELSFFNALAGGPERGATWLNDSNLDWGQDLRRLCRELERRGLAEETTIAYFGGADPTADCPKARLFDAERSPVTPGVYAVSSFILTTAPELMTVRGRPDAAAGYEALRRAVRTRGRLVGRVGYSIFIVRITGAS